MKYNIVRSIGWTFTLVIALFSMVLYSSCEKDPPATTDLCAGVECRNGGYCFEGQCECTAGYYGDNCEKKANARYLGNWTFTQEVQVSNDSSRVGKKDVYQVTITDDESGATVLNFEGFYGNAAYTIKGRLGRKIGSIEIDGKSVESDVFAENTSFIFNRYQTFGSEGYQLSKGEGVIDELGEQISGQFFITYPDAKLGAIEEAVTFTADYIY